MSRAQQKQVCVTVDDLPVVNYGKNDPEFLEEVTSKLISTFNSYSIPAIGYVNGGKLYDQGILDEDRVTLLKKWLKSGYNLGNHTFSHYNYHKTSFTDFTEDVLNGEDVIKDLTQQFKRPYEYFRHPYLRIGASKESADSLRQFLKAHGYREAPVTIDPDDYLFAKVYQIALNKADSTKAKKVADAYLVHMESKILFYEKLSQELFSRDIAHTLLIHANLLNADYLDEVAEIFKKHGYTFVSQEEVLKDSAYSSPVTKYGDWGMSWMDRWAMSNEKYDLLGADPKVPEFIR